MKYQMFFLAVTVLLAGSAFGATWTVAKDGSGDFTVIQDAVDAAADGDVIEIGPGQYEEYQFFDGDLYGSHVRVVDKDLTFIGAGPDKTVIGTEESIDNLWIYGIRAFDCQSIHVENLSVAVDRGRCADFQIPTIEFENCTFFSQRTYNAWCYGVLPSYVENGIIRGCKFFDLDVAVGFYGPVQGLVVEDCEFIKCGYGVNAENRNPGGLGISCAFQNCLFDGQWDYWSSGINFGSDAQLNVTDCSFMRCSSYSLRFEGNDYSTVRDCVIEDVGGGNDHRVGCVILADEHKVRFENNIITSDYLCFKVHGNGTPHISSFNQNHILVQGGGYYVVGIWGVYWNHPDEILNMVNNYWGTTDEDAIARRIMDGGPEFGFVVEYLPLADGPVPVQSVTLDEVKSFFR